MRGLGTLRPLGFFCLAAAICSASLAMGGAGSAAASAVATRPVTNYPGQLFAVSADSRSDAWAVGDTPMSGKTLVLHWNGRSWKEVTSPSVGGGPTLFGVSARTASDAWAVGAYYTVHGNTRALILHWNGARWSRVSSQGPQAAPTGSQLTSVSAVSARDAWAVGFYFPPNGESESSVVLHWNGVRWSRVSSANPTAFNALYGVSAGFDRAAFAVGADQNGTLLERWNGTSWVKRAAPNPNSLSSFTGVSAASGSNAWVVGAGTHRGTIAPKTLVAHWTGTKWTQIASPSPGADSSLMGVSALRSSAWAVGYFYWRKVKEVPLIVRCTTAGCNKVPAPNPGGSTGTQLNGVSAVSRSDAWAVASIDLVEPDYSRTVILHWNGTKWTRS